jgi:hypothetical protein
VAGAAELRETGGDRRHGLGFGSGTSGTGSGCSPDAYSSSLATGSTIQVWSRVGSSKHTALTRPCSWRGCLTEV